MSSCRYPVICFPYSLFVCQQAAHQISQQKCLEDTVIRITEKELYDPWSIAYYLGYLIRRRPHKKYLYYPDDVSVGCYNRWPNSLTTTMIS